MYSLYFSISSPIIFLAILKDEKLLSSISENNYRMHSENFIEKISNILSFCELELSMINSIYFTSSDNNQQTGIRVSLTFVSAIKALNPKILIYHINELFLQEFMIKSSFELNKKNNNLEKFDFFNAFQKTKFFFKELSDINDLLN